MNVRQRALRAINRMDGVSSLQPRDLFTVLKRRTTHYREPITLAAHVLTGHGRALEHGAAPARSFLFRTPELIEDGIRTLLSKGLAGEWKVVKRGLQLGSSAVTMNPDLVFNDGAATGDVKYKLSNADWNRADLNQAVAFAAAFRARHSCVIAFVKPGAAEPPTVSVGDFHVTHIAWPADPALEAAVAADELISRVVRWLHEYATSTAPDPANSIASGAAL
jgi:5-methylcytosine-specific restriction endonuclease McrBC regulatory subunit McrC